MGEKKWYFPAKVVKKFSFAYLLLSFPPMLSEKKLFCMIFFTFENWIWLCPEPSKKERWLENSFCVIAEANDASQVAWSDN